MQAIRTLDRTNLTPSPVCDKTSATCRIHYLRNKISTGTIKTIKNIRGEDMKCSSCSAENAPGATFCEYCGTNLKTKPTADEVFDKNTGSETAQTARTANIFPKMTDPAFQLWSSKCNLQRNKFNWIAFFFPAGYLAGYGAISSALAVILSMLALVFVAAILAGVFGKSYILISAAVTIISLVYFYRLAVRVESIIGKKPNKAEFNWLHAIGFTFLYSIILGGLF